MDLFTSCTNKFAKTLKNDVASHLDVTMICVTSLDFIYESWIYVCIIRYLLSSRTPARKVQALMKMTTLLTPNTMTSRKQRTRNMNTTVL